ncbi:MAG: c-type cytochrome [Betaproteobacteria bacterium]|nr:c-type cytochrome [Betaproteobacteria bacterium]
MRLKSVTLAMTLSLTLATVTWQDGALAAKADSCANCHGIDGNSSSWLYPNLAGQTVDYLVTQMKLFKEQKRKNYQMNAALQVLSEQDMKEIAEFFNSQLMTRESGSPDPAVLEEGRKLLDEAKCDACHQKGYLGMSEFPRLARQKWRYLAKQMKAYRDGKRESAIMAPTVKNFTDEQINAMSQYLSRL